MIDWVSPRLRGDAAAQSFQAVRVPCAAGRVAGGQPLRELAAVMPHLVSAAAACLPPVRASRVVVTAGGRRVQAAVSASSPSSARMWQAWRTILRACDSAAILPSLRSLTAA